MSLLGGYRGWLLAAGAAAASVVVLVGLARGPDLGLPPPLTADGLRGTPAARIVPLATADLRGALTRQGKPGAWRDLPAAARHVYAISWVQTDPGDAGTPPTSGFSGFRALTGRSGAGVPTLDEIAEAYQAVGAPAVAAVATEASHLAASAGAAAGPDPFGALDREFAAVSARDGAIGLLRAYVAAHADEIAVAW